MKHKIAIAALTTILIIYLGLFCRHPIIAGFGIILGVLLGRLLPRATGIIILALIGFELGLLTPNTATAQGIIFWHPWYLHPAHQAYTITPYGGLNYRTQWINYPPPDTSWGYRQGRPRAKDFGIRGHQLTHPNPRSLYRPQ